MRRPSTLLSIRTLVGGLFLLLLGVRRAEAQYLDPGTGSVVIQVLIAVVVGAAAAVKLYWTKISGLLRRRTKRDTGL
jgi:hypothetical protein